jgi:hypothetical protein
LTRAVTERSSANTSKPNQSGREKGTPLIPGLFFFSRALMISHRWSFPPCHARLFAE